MADSVVLYEERGSVAVVSLNRPERLNTLTEELVQGVADAIDRAAASREVRSVVLRGEGRAFTAGYDLEATGASLEAGWSQPYDAPRPEPRPGAWDPVRDYRSMGRNVERFMKIWDCPKPVLGAIHGWAVGTLFDGMTRHTEEAYRWAESLGEQGLRRTAAARDAPFGDYSARPREDWTPQEQAAKKRP